MMEGRVRRRKQVVDDRREMAGYCKLKEEDNTHCVENWLWTFREIDYEISEYFNLCVLNL